MKTLKLYALFGPDGELWEGFINQRDIVRFKISNRFCSGWKKIYKSGYRIRPVEIKWKERKGKK